MWNPYFDWCAMFLPQKPIPPKQRKSGPKNKAFENIIAHMHNNMGMNKTWYPQNEWPWKERLFIMVAFSGPKGYLEYADVDNLAKAALDAYKGIVYLDDRQVFYLLAFKNDKPVDWIPRNQPSLTIAIKKIDANFKLTTVPQFYTDEGSKEKDSPAQISFHMDGRNFHYEFPERMTDKDLEKVNRMVKSEVEKLRISQLNKSTRNGIKN